MKSNNFEDQFREAFSGYEPVLPTDEIWGQVEPHLKKKKKRRFFFFWWLLGGLGLGLLGYGLNQSLLNKSITGRPVIESKENNSPSVKLFISSEEECVELNSDVSIPIASAVKKSFVKTFRSEKNKTIFSVAIIEKSVRSDEAENKKITYSDLQVVDPETGRPLDEKLNDKALTEKQKTTPVKTTEANLKSKKTAKSAIEKEEKQKQKKKKSKKKKKRIRPLRNKWKFHMQAVTGPVLPIRIMTTNRDGEFTNFRKDSEKPVGGFSISSNFVAESPRGLILSGGLEYIEFRERFRYERMNERTDVSIGTVAVVENAEGEVIETINGPVSTITTTTRRIRHTNEYRYFSLPIGIGKAWRNRKNYWRVYGGLDFNLGFSFKGKIFTESFTTNPPVRELSPRENSTFYDGFYKRKAGLGLWLSTEYSRPITNQLSWMIAPRIKLPLSSITVPDYEIKQRYVPISVQVGINYLINPPKKKKRRVKEKTSDSF